MTDKVTLTMVVTACLSFGGFMATQMAGLAWISIALITLCVIMTAWSIIRSSIKNGW